MALFPRLPRGPALVRPAPVIAACDTPASADLAPDHLDRNLTALAGVDAAAAAFLRARQPVDGAVAATGRDGAATFTWRDTEGRLKWLGRSSMPTISAPAQIDAFQPGQGNSLIVDIGHGWEVAGLAARLARHQAVFVVVEHPAEALLGLRLHDFSDDIAAGRIVLCAGEDPWKHLTDTLTATPGILPPDRVLCRPWYDPSRVTELSRRLESLAKEVDGRRSGAGSEPRPPRPRDSDFRLALVSNVPEAAVARLADSLEAAAAELGWACRRHTLSTPRWVDPRAIESDLREFQPDIGLSIGAPVGALAYALPDCPTAVICAHGWGLSEEWLGQIPATCAVVVRSPEQIGQLRAAGVSADRLVHWPPAARSVPSEARIKSPDQVFMLCDGLDASPAAVGLNLDTHQKLWHEARSVIESQLDGYTDADAESVLRTAARRLNITLQSDEVIGGLTTRIRSVLAPATVREGVLSRLHAAGIDFQIFGAGRFTDPTIASRHRGPWPVPRDSARLAAQCRAAVSIETGAHLPDGFLDCAVAGAALYQRAAAAKHDAVRFAGLDAVGAAINPYRSATGLQKLLESSPVPIDTVARESARAFLASAHTWAHRLAALRHQLTTPSMRRPA